MNKYFLMALLLGFFGQKAMAENSQMCLDLNALRVSRNINIAYYDRKASEARENGRNYLDDLKTKENFTQRFNLVQAALEKENCISSHGFSNEGPSYNDERFQSLTNSAEENLSLFRDFLYSQEEGYDEKYIGLIRSFREEEASEKTKDDFLKGDALNATNGNELLYQVALASGIVMAGSFLLKKVYDTYKAYTDNHDAQNMAPRWFSRFFSPSYGKEED